MDTHPPYTHSVCPMSCGRGSPHAEVNALNKTLSDRNRLLGWRGHPVMATGLPGNSRARQLDPVQHPVVIGIGAADFGTGMRSSQRAYFPSKSHSFEGRLSFGPPK
jgi:hypothetical protein